MTTLPLLLALAIPFPPAHAPAAAVPIAPPPAVSAAAVAAGASGGQGAGALQPEPDRAWESPLGHLRHATLMHVGLAGGQLLVEDSRHGVSALDPATGAARWFVQMPGALDVWPSDGDGALVLASGTDLVVVDSSTGHRLREISTASLAADSPVSDSRMVYIPSLLGNQLVAIDLVSGLTPWQFPMGSPFSGPALVMGDNARRSVLVTCEDGTLRSVPGGPTVPDTERWVAHVGRLQGAPVFDGRHVFVSTTERLVMALDAGAGTTVWRHLPGEPLVGHPVLGAGLLVVATDSHVIGLEAATGAVRWQRAQADLPLEATATVVHVARADGGALLDPADGHDLAVGLPRDVLLAGDLLIHLREGAVLVANHLPPR